MKAQSGAAEKIENFDQGDSSLAESVKLLADEVRSLRAQIERSHMSQHTLVTAPKESQALLKISIDRVHGERKPFILRFDGELQGECKLSSMRAAIFLVLLMDIQDRCEGGSGFSDTLQEVSEVYRELDPLAEGSENLLNIVRVGIYRFEFSLDDEPMFNGERYKLVYKSSNRRLELVSSNETQLEVAAISITVASSDTSILSTIDRLSRGSPLARLRRQKSIYVSSGARGWEHLFMEYFEHKHKVRNTSMFYRPALPTYPDSLLKMVGATAATLKRKQVMLEGYSSGRVEFVEILLRETIWDLITVIPGKGFKLYPPQVKVEQVREHLEEMINQVTSYPNYNLVLTDAPFPFILGVVELFSEQMPEYFTMFYRQHIGESAIDWTCFAMSDPATAQNVLKNVIGAVMAHPSTVSGANAVREELNKVLDHLITNGPKKAGQKSKMYAA